MRIRKVIIRRFRNLEDVCFFPDERLNLFTGRNAQGKTSILESLCFLSTLKSFRRAKPEEVIQRGGASAEVQCEMSFRDEHNQEWSSKLKLGFGWKNNRAGKNLWINEKLCRSGTDYLSQRFRASHLGFHTIVFNPSDHDIVRGEPKVRRDYLNQVIASEDQEYLLALQNYQRILEQRNRLLNAEPRGSQDALNVFSEQLIGTGGILIHSRLKWLHRLMGRLNTVLRFIAPGQRSLSIKYELSWDARKSEKLKKNDALISEYFSGQGPVPSLEELIQEFRRQLYRLQVAEWNTQTTLCGPHRDDWMIYLGNTPLKAQGSQGEIRSALLALKLCEMELFREKTKMHPVFLLDDFSSELDRQRRNFLLKFIETTDLQVFVTTTEAFPIQGKHFCVDAGKLLQLSKQMSKESEHGHDARNEPA